MSERLLHGVVVLWRGISSSQSPTIFCSRGVIQKCWHSSVLEGRICVFCEQRWCLDRTDRVSGAVSLLTVRMHIKMGTMGAGEIRLANQLFNGSTHTADTGTAILFMCYWSVEQCPSRAALPSVEKIWWPAEVLVFLSPLLGMIKWHITRGLVEQQLVFVLAA